MFTLLPLLEIATVTQAHFANPGSRTVRCLLAKGAVTLVHGVQMASEAGFVTQFALSGRRRSGIFRSRNLLGVGRSGRQGT